MNLTYLKAERIKKNLTQEELAVKLGITRSYISLIETLKKVPGRFLTLEIERFFNKPIDELLKIIEI